MSSHKKQFPLVLGSGGARGLAHIGVIKALEENQIPVNLIIGTSIGALIGGLYASGKNINTLEKIVQEVNKIMVAKILMPKLFAPGFIDNKKVIDFIKELVGDVKIENLKIPFAAVATDLISGEEVIFDKGLLVDAIMASVAIPTIFQPVFLKNHYLIDGGLSNPLPISVAKEMEAQKIIAVNVSPNPKKITKKTKSKKTEEIKLLIKKLPSLFTNLLNENKQRLPHSDLDKNMVESEIVQLYSPTILNVFLQSISISTNNLIMQHLRHAKPDILISPNIEDYDMLEFYKEHEIIKCGYDAALKALPEIQLCK
jgi:NTE family protein